MWFFWKDTKKKRPTRTDYVLITDDKRVTLAIYDKSTDTFVPINPDLSCDPLYWEYVPLHYKKIPF